MQVGVQRSRRGSHHTGSLHGSGREVEFSAEVPRLSALPFQWPVVSHDASVAGFILGYISVTDVS